MKEYNFKAKIQENRGVFTFIVSEEDYKEIMNEEPSKLRKNIFTRDKYNIYPNDLFQEPYDSCEEYLRLKDKEYEINIKIKEVN